jgi:hypothetical protein
MDKLLRWAVQGLLRSLHLKEQLLLFRCDAAHQGHHFFEKADALCALAHCADLLIFLKWHHGFEVLKQQNRCKAEG